MPFDLPVLASSGALPPLVRDIGVCLVAAGVLAVLCVRLRLPAIAGFLAAGVLVGPVAGGLVTDRGAIDTIAGLGLVLLLFVIGLEMDVRKLLDSGRTLLVTGALQFPLCVAFGFASATVLAASGLESIGGGFAPLYVGFTLAASSTLILAKLLQERRQLDTRVGRVAIGLLIIQDIWSIVVLAIQPNFAHPSVSEALATFAGIAALAVFAFATARLVLPAAFRWIAKLPELLLVAAVAWCFGVGFVGYHLGDILAAIGIDAHVEVSMEMGALIAGSSIAALPYSAEVVAKVGTVRDFFVTLFFVGLGMGIPRPDGATVLILAAVLAGLCLAARALVFLPLLYASGMDRRNAVVASARLAQVSEFCLVIAYLGQAHGHVDGEFVSSVIFAFVATALASPWLFDLGDRIHDRCGTLLSRLGMRPPPAARLDAGGGAAVDVAILGFHRYASSFYREIERRRPELLPRVRVVDFNVAQHAEIGRRGASVVYGDISNFETLHHAGIEHAKIVFSTVPDDLLKGTSNERLVRSLRHHLPHAQIVATALRFDEAARIYAAGADFVLLPRVEGAHVLMDALEAALSDTLAGLRREHEERDGRPRERGEVMP